MSFKRGNKRDVEDILVAKGVNNTVRMVTGVPVIDGTDNIPLADGQLGVMSMDNYGTVTTNNFLAGGETGAQVKAIKVLQGTSASSNLASADPWQVGALPVVETGVISANMVRSAVIRKPRVEVYSGNVITDLSAPLSQTDYGIQVELESNQFDKTYGDNTNLAKAMFFTPDFTAVTVADELSYTLTNVLTKLNRQSEFYTGIDGKLKGKDPFVAFAVRSTAGGAGIDIGTITVGTSIPFMTVNGVTSSVVATKGMVAGLAKLLKAQADDVAAGKATLAITATSSIEVIDIANAATADNLDAVIIMGTEDTDVLGVNTNPFKTVDATADVTDGFRASVSLTKSFNEEAKGYNWDLANRRRAQRAKHNLYSNTDYPSFNVVEGYNAVEAIPYTSIVIDYFDFEDTLTTKEYDPKQATILLPAAVDLTEDVATVLAAYTADPADLFSVIAASFDGAASAVNFTADVNAVLIAWLNSTDAQVDGTL
jgi:hypothetical protein